MQNLFEIPTKIDVDFSPLATIVSAELLAEQNLANFLLNTARYNPAIRPVAKYTDKLTINHRLDIAQLLKLVRSYIIT